VASATYQRTVGAAGQCQKLTLNFLSRLLVEGLRRSVDPQRGKQIVERK
jgi:hypothetical protein